MCETEEGKSAAFLLFTVLGLAAASGGLLLLYYFSLWKGLQ